MILALSSELLKKIGSQRIRYKGKCEVLKE
jgi:hypothetical protein